jgi:hypothetical protein
VRSHDESHEHADGEGHRPGDETHAGGEGHGPGEESSASRRHVQPVVLDIGQEVGALIVHTPGNMIGIEVEISPTGRDGERSHKDVLEREIKGRPVFAAVFEEVREGGYTLWVDDQARERDVLIRGGSIAELDWVAEPVVRSGR